MGDRLPAESEMLTQYGVSRESLREGLRLLEVQGLISIRRGPGGGPYVAPVNASYLARTASMYYNLSGATYSEVFDTWLDLEPLIAAKVARIADRRRKTAALAPFLDDHEPQDDQQHFEELNNFHSVLASLAGNRVTTLLVQSVTHIVVDHVVEDMNPLEIPHLDGDHHDIAVAVIDGRTRKARDLMHDHIAAVVDHYRTQHARPHGDARSPGAEAHRPSAPPSRLDEHRLQRHLDVGRLVLRDGQPLRKTLAHREVLRCPVDAVDRDQPAGR